MSVYNNVNLLGRLTKIPTLQTTESKGKTKEYCNFTLAVQRVGYDGADFIFCTAWGGTAKYLTNAKWINTKDIIAVNGEIQTYQNSEGQNQVSIRVANASRVSFNKDNDEEEASKEEGIAPIDRVVITTETYAEKMAKLKRTQGDDYAIEEEDTPF